MTLTISGYSHAVWIVKHTSHISAYGGRHFVYSPLAARTSIPGRYCNVYKERIDSYQTVRHIPTLLYISVLTIKSKNREFLSSSYNYLGHVIQTGQLTES